MLRDQAEVAIAIAEAGEAVARENRMAKRSRLSRRPRARQTFKRGDRVEWNSEAGRVRGIVTRKVTSDVQVKGYTHHATKAEPQYFIKSLKTDHVAIHKGRALRRLK